MSSPMHKIGNRQTVLLAQARMLEGHRYLKSAEISALNPNDMQRNRLASMPVTQRQVALLRAMYEISGRPTRVGTKREDGFCGALQRHRRHQLRVGAVKLRRRARALDKVAQKYIFRPSVEMDA